MRYVIGSTIIDKKTGKDTTGYYAITSYGMDFILEKNGQFEDLSDKSYYIYVFNNIESVTQYTRALSRAYRRDDVAFSKPKIKSKKIRRFYPLKVDSSNFKLTLDDKKYKTGIFKYNEYYEEINNSTCSYDIYKILNKK